MYAQECLSDHSGPKATHRIEMGSYILTLTFCRGVRSSLILLWVAFAFWLFSWIGCFMFLHFDCQSSGRAMYCLVCLLGLRFGLGLLQVRLKFEEHHHLTFLCPILRWHFSDLFGHHTSPNLFSPIFSSVSIVPCQPIPPKFRGWQFHPLNLAGGPQKTL